MKGSRLSMVAMLASVVVLLAICLQVCAAQGTAETDTLSLISTLELPPVPAGPRRFTEVDYKNDTAQGFVDNSAAFGFTAAVSPHKQDILSAMLAAQLNSDFKFDRYSNSIDWYKNYVSVLSNLGMALTSFTFVGAKSQGNTFTVANGVLTILEAMLTGNELAVAKAALDSLKDDKSDRFTMWAESATSGEDGNFQVHCVDETHGVAQLSISAYLMTTQTSEWQFLWFSYSSTQIQLQGYSTTIFLVDSVWTDKVRAKLYAKVLTMSVTISMIWTSN